MNEVNTSSNKKALTQEELLEKSMRRQKFMVDYVALAFLILILIGNAIFTPNFISAATLRNIVVQSTQIFLIGMGLTFVFAIGEIDISTGSMMCFIAVLMIKLFDVVGVVPAILIGLVTAAIIGGILGGIISYLNTIPVVVTMAFQMLLRGLALVISEGTSISFNQPDLLWIGRLSFTSAKIPVQLIYIIIFTLIFYFIANKTVFGKRIAMIGNNKKAAKLCGINHQMYSVIVHAMVAVMAGIAGLISIARTSAVAPTTLGLGVEMDCVAAVAIGGTNLKGGRPNVVGTLIGSIIIAVLFITLVMHDIQYEAQQILKGAIIVVSVLLRYEKKS